MASIHAQYLRFSAENPGWTFEEFLAHLEELKEATYWHYVAVKLSYDGYINHDHDYYYDLRAELCFDELDEADSIANAIYEARLYKKPNRKQPQPKKKSRTKRSA